LSDIDAATGTVRSVSRALNIVFALEPGPKSVTLIARETGLSAVTTRRLLGSLMSHDLVVLDRSAAIYRLGPAWLTITDSVARDGTSRPSVRVARARHESAVRSVARASDILLALGEGPQSLGRIAQRTSLTKPTAHRLLAALVYRQMVVQDKATGAYLIGPRAMRIAGRAQ
jgi:DNA-binding IclR family transcriptional regulator